MPASLVDSQFATLEEPGPEERPITVSVEPEPMEIVRAVAAAVRGKGGVPAGANQAKVRA